MMEEAEQRKAYSYLRFSSPEQAKGDSFRRQTSLAIDYSRSHNLSLDETLTFHDLGVSAYQGVNSETGQLNTLLEAVRIGLIPRGSIILVESLDRISRQTARKALRVIEDILESGVTVVTLSDGREYTTESLDHDPMNLLIALITFIRANEESTIKSQRLAAVWVRKRQMALEKPMTARCVSWLKLDQDRNSFIVIEEFASTIRRIFIEFIAGKSIKGIARDLNIDKIPIPNNGGRKGKFWLTTSLALLLKNPSVMGTLIPCNYQYVRGNRVRNKPNPIENYYPAIISSEDFMKVQLLRQKSMHSGLGAELRAQPLRNIFGRLSQCALCGSSMVYYSRTKTIRYLICRKVSLSAGCEFKTVKYNELESSFAQKFFSIISKLEIYLNPIFRQRFDDIHRLLHSESIDRPALNAALRVVLKLVAIDPFKSTMTLHWKHGEISIIRSTFVKEVPP